MLFTAALQLANPWKVIDVSFRDAAGGKRELRITVGYGPGSRFHCPEAKCREESCPVHDTAERTWRHSDFFQYKAHIHALVPRVACQAHGVRTVPVPWARPGSGVRAPVRGHGRRARQDAAGGGRRGAGRRARHEAVAVHPPLRGRGQARRGLHGCGGHRHRRVYFVKLRWTCSALNLDTVGVQLEHRRRLVPCFVVCLVYFMRECLFR